MFTIFYRWFGGALFLTLALWPRFGTAQASDGVFVQVEDKVGKVVYHRVGTRETIYSIANLYGTTVRAIRSHNPRLPQGRLSGIVKVPIREDQMLYRLPLFKSKKDLLPVYYEVKPQDNVFRVSRIYFSMPTNLLVSRNKIRNNELKPGQTLRIGWIKSAQGELEVLAGRNKDSHNEDASRQYEREFLESLDDLDAPTINEVAFWKKDSAANGYFVMHRKAKERSYIEITNPLSSAKLYAKVIGNIPDHLYPEEVDMVLSQELAEALGAKDSKFFVRVRYKH
ncbi:MAG: LysM peptidoglycan-binding domain-containing protein [Saprospiraceae bacterium]|nr:LysM peptidoglycan-binding domain-containing protein [Saprospiraceae bacterium]